MSQAVHVQSSRGRFASCHLSMKPSWSTFKRCPHAPIFIHHVHMDGPWKGALKDPLLCFCFARLLGEWILSGVPRFLTKY